MLEQGGCRLLLTAAMPSSPPTDAPPRPLARTLTTKRPRVANPYGANLTGSFSDLCETLCLKKCGPPEFSARHQLQNELSKIRAFYQKLPLQHAAQKNDVSR